MREIKFRGMAHDDWYYGDLITASDKDKNKHYYIITEDYEGDCIELGTCASPEVEQETIGQYTGLKDKNGKEIYEGDIVEYANRYKYIVCSGEYNTNPKHCTEAIILGIYLKEIKIGEVNHLYCINGVAAKFPVHCAESEIGIENFKLEVIGNIYENKELLEG